MNGEHVNRGAVCRTKQQKACTLVQRRQEKKIKSFIGWSGQEEEISQKRRGNPNKFVRNISKVPKMGQWVQVGTAGTRMIFFLGLLKKWK